ncbi:universal stress protein [Pedobacter psychroterrae]|uniref:Universal stress protein n=1 Tax=Pedobacter psychroterrae TaxID=2530453 RepID=A0A4R0NL33_9SPHI|nr:universal stress protein [Pedobacter psychroterrae]TCD01512.1 universal stress protein [Pedobacter psychroterrae]
MKTILVTTDFSAPSQTAGRFALYLANALKADLTLCHAVKRVIASVSPVLTDQYAEQRNSALEQLEFQALDLRADQQESGISGLQIDCCSAPGPITDLVSSLTVQKEITLVVMGMFGAGMINRILLGSNSQDLINSANFPVLLIPFKKFPEKIDKIAFASDLSTGDIGLINSLAGFARAFNAEILIVHIGETKVDQAQVDSFLSEVTGKVKYPKIYYRHVEDKNASRGLNWIAKNGFIDIFAMVHRKQHFPGNLFSSSHTQKLSRDIEIPLLVFQENQYPVF